jgi:hypothetical protein
VLIGNRLGTLGTRQPLARLIVRPTHPCCNHVGKQRSGNVRECDDQLIGRKNLLARHAKQQSILRLVQVVSHLSLIINRQDSKTDQRSFLHRSVPSNHLKFMLVVALRFV